VKKVHKHPTWRRGVGPPTRIPFELVLFRVFVYFRVFVEGVLFRVFVWGVCLLGCLFRVFVYFRVFIEGVLRNPCSLNESRSGRFCTPFSSGVRYFAGIVCVRFVPEAQDGAAAQDLQEVAELRRADCARHPADVPAQAVPVHASASQGDYQGQGRMYEVLSYRANL